MSAEATERVAEVALLLDAVGRHGSDLAQHVLARVVETGAAAQHGLAGLADVPREPAARLELLPLIGNRAVRREPRVVQEWREGGRLRIDGFRHELRVPPEAVVDRQAVARLPLVLDEQRELLVVDVRRAGRVARDAVGAAALQVEQQRPAGRRGPGGTAGGAVTYAPFEQPIVFGPNPPGAAGEVYRRNPVTLSKR